MVQYVMPCCCPAESDVVDDKSIASEIQSLRAKGIKRCKPPELQVTHECRTIVTLNIYHLTQRNKPLRKLGFGIFHVGVVIFGMEWSFGESIQGGNSTGLFFHTPGLAGVGFKTIEIGQTTLSPVQVDTILHRLENEWRSCDYHILHRNCNHFAQRFCDLLSTLTPLRVPSWCNRAARISDKVIPRLIASKIQKRLNKNAQPPKASGPPGSSPTTKSGGSTGVSDDFSSPTRSPRNSILSGTPEGGDGAQHSSLPLSVIPVGWYNHPMVYQVPKYRCVANTDELTFPEWRIPEQYRNQRDRESSSGPDGFWSIRKRSSGCFIHPSTLPTEMWCSQGEGGLIIPKKALKLDSSMNSTSCGYSGKLDGMEGNPETAACYASPGADTNPSSPQLETEGCEYGSAYNPTKEPSRCSVSSPPAEKVLLSCRPSPNVEVSKPFTSNASSFHPATLMPSRRSVGRNSPLPRPIPKMSQGFLLERKAFSRSNSTDNQSTASSSWNSPQLHQEYNRGGPIRESSRHSECPPTPSLFSAASWNQSPLQSHIPLSAFSAVETTNVVLTHTSLASKEVRVIEQRFAADRKKRAPTSPAAPSPEENSIPLLHSPESVRDHRSQSLWSNRSPNSSSKESHRASSVSVIKVPSLDMIELSNSPLDIKKISRPKRGRRFSQTWSFTRDVRYEINDSPIGTAVSGNLCASGISKPRSRRRRAPSAPTVGNDLWMQ